jgi:mRNA interferase HigB
MVFSLCKHEHNQTLTDQQPNHVETTSDRKFVSISNKEAPMHLISATKLKEAATSYPDVEEVLKNFCKKIDKSAWQNLVEVQQDYRGAEAVGNFTVFNIKGNKYRLILDIDYEEQVAYFKYFLTHAEYDKDLWKNDSYY